MRIFLDTNVILDYLTARGNEKATKKIFESIDSGENIGFISTGSFYTIIYLAERFLKDFLQSNSATIEVLTPKEFVKKHLSEK